jgi:hypothetical protein
MRRYILLLSIVFLLSGCAITRRTASKKFLDEKGNVIKQAEDIVILTPEQRLPEYEKLTFRIRWLGLHVGDVTLEIKGMQEVNGRSAYVLEAAFKSNAFLSAIYKINDRFVSYMDVEKLCSLRHEVYRSEGNYKKDAATDFDHENKKAHFKNYLDKSEKTFDIPSGVQDTLSACYYFMLLPLKEGDRIEYTVCNNEENYQLIGVVESKAFIKTVPFGEKQAFHVQPYARLKGEKVEKGNLRAYFGCDKRRLPLLGVLKGPVFTEVTIALIKAEYKSQKEQP